MRSLTHYLTVFVLLASLCTVAPRVAGAQTDAVPLEGRSLYGSASLGGPAGGYTVSVEHLFVRTPSLQIGMRIGGSYARNLVWEGAASAVSAGVLAVRRLGALGSSPVGLEGGVGVTRVHEDLCDERSCSGLVSRTAPHFYASGAVRVTAMDGRLAYRVGIVTLVSDDDPLLLPMLGIGVGLF